MTWLREAACPAGEFRSGGRAPAPGGADGEAPSLPEISPECAPPASWPTWRLDIHRSRRGPQCGHDYFTLPQQITDGQLDVAEMTDPEQPGLAGPFLLLALNLPLGLKDEVLI